MNNRETKSSKQSKMRCAQKNKQQWKNMVGPQKPLEIPRPCFPGRSWDTFPQTRARASHKSAICGPRRWVVNSCKYRPVGEKQTKQRRVVCVCAFLAVCASAYLINDVTETRSKGAEGEKRERQTVLPNVQPSDQALKEELFNFKFPLIWSSWREWTHDHCS